MRIGVRCCFEKEFPRQGHTSGAHETENLTRVMKVVCANCKDFGFTAHGWQAYQCSGTCKRKLLKSAFSVRPDNVARDEEKGTLKCKTCK
eukprot:8764318-Pyramimonas_sp.AAC.1